MPLPPPTPRAAQVPEDAPRRQPDARRPPPRQHPAARAQERQDGPAARTGMPRCWSSLSPSPSRSRARQIDAPRCLTSAHPSRAHARARRAAPRNNSRSSSCSTSGWWRGSSPRSRRPSSASCRPSARGTARGRGGACSPSRRTRRASRPRPSAPPWTPSSSRAAAAVRLASPHAFRPWTPMTLMTDPPTHSHDLHALACQRRDAPLLLLLPPTRHVCTAPRLVPFPRADGTGVDFGEVLRGVLGLVRTLAPRRTSLGGVTPHHPPPRCSHWCAPSPAGAHAPRGARRKLHDPRHERALPRGHGAGAPGWSKWPSW